MARIAILSDIHANREALDAVLADVQGADLFWSIGDVIGYGPDPAYCLEKLKALRAFSVQGNHELAVLKILDKEFDIGFNMIAFEAILWTSRNLSPQHIDLVRTFPTSLVSKKVHLVHGCPPDDVRTYLHHDPSMLKSVAGMVKAPICVIGHTHFPGIAFSEEPKDRQQRNGAWHGVPLDQGRGMLAFRDDMRVFLNPGSVGQPRDGISLASYAVLDTGRNEIRIRRVQYDVDKTKAKMLKQGLPEVLAYRLAVGR